MPAMQTFAASIGQRLYGIYAGLTFGLVTLSTVGLLAVVPGEPRRRRVVRRSARLIFTLIGARPMVAGLERLPDEPCVVVANHCSYLDGVILTAALPPRFAFVIKQEMRNIPIAHFLLRRIGSEFVERFNRHQGATDARRILQKAEQRDSLAFFPEGTFTHEPGLRRFQKGAFVAASRGTLPVVPVVIRGSRGMLPAGRWLAAPGQLSVIVKTPLHTAEDDIHGLIARTRDSILEDLGEPNQPG